MSNYYTLSSPIQLKKNEIPQLTTNSNIARSEVNCGDSSETNTNPKKKKFINVHQNSTKKPANYK
jgi:hypothetical protein